MSKGLMVSRRGVCPQQPLCAPPPEMLDGAGTPKLVEGLAYVLAPQARVKVSSSRDAGIATKQQMREPSAFLCASVCLCLGSLIPESAPPRALVEGKPSHKGGDQGQRWPRVLWVLRDMKLF